MVQHSIPSPRELRRFGLALGIALALMAGLVLPGLGGRPIPLWPWVAGIALAALAGVTPRLLLHPHRGWMRLTHLIAMVLTPVVAGFIFFVVVTPMGLIRRAFGSDPMARRIDPGATSYRVPCKRTTPADMRKPF